MGKYNKFITGALVGLGLGLLIAPTEENESKKELNKSLRNLLDSVKNIDVEKTKSAFMKRLTEIRDELNDLSDETRKELVKVKINKIKETCLELEAISKEYDKPIVEMAAKEVEERADSLLEEINKVKKTVTVKKKSTSSTKKRTRKNVTKKVISKKTK